LELIFIFLHFSGTFLNHRAAVFPSEEWASLSVFAANERLQAELGAIARLGHEISDVTADLTRRQHELENLQAEKARVDQLSGEISTSMASAMEAARQAKATVQARHAEVDREVDSLQSQIEAQEVALTERRARLHSLALEAARLDASARTITDSYNQANYGLMQVMSFVGASSLGSAENYQVLRTAMSKFFQFYVLF